MTDENREQIINSYKKFAVRAFSSGNFRLSAMLFSKMDQEISKRSPVQVAKMEREMGLV